MTDIETEFDRCLDPLDEQGQAAYLRRLGVPTGVIYGARSLVGLGRIVPCDDGFFEFHDHGDLALIVAEGEPDLPGWHFIEDLVAFLPDEPGRWWLRRGAVQLLGAYNMRDAKIGETRLRATPLDWLQCGAQGVSVLDWTLDPAELRDGVGAGLVADSAALRDRLLDRVREAAVEPWRIGVAHASA